MGSSLWRLWLPALCGALWTSEASSRCTGRLSKDLAASDCTAWQALYDATGGADWHDCADLRHDPCLCRRVLCHDGKRVHRLLLHRNNLRGTIPFSIGEFDRLEVLGLLQNKLTGTLPPSLGRMTWLEMLFAGDNALYGTVPPELSSLVSLESLYLSNNSLTGTLPRSLAKLTNLESLFVGYNKLGGPLPTGLDFTQFEDCSTERCCTLAGGSNRFACPLPRDAVKNCDINATQCDHENGTVGDYNVNNNNNRGRDEL